MSSYLLGVADKVSLDLVEVERVAAAQLTIDHLPLLVEPALWRVVPPLQHDVIALETAREVVPGCGHEGILPLEILDFLVCGGLGHGC